MHARDRARGLEVGKLPDDFFERRTNLPPREVSAETEVLSDSEANVAIRLASDVESLGKWDEYTDVKNAMFIATNTKCAPWTVVRSDDKKRARLATMRYFLSRLDYPEKDVEVIGVPDSSIIGPPERIYLGNDD